MRIVLFCLLLSFFSLSSFIAPVSALQLSDEKQKTLDTIVEKTQTRIDTERSPQKERELVRHIYARIYQAQQTQNTQREDLLRYFLGALGIPDQQYSSIGPVTVSVLRHLPVPILPHPSLRPEEEDATLRRYASRINITEVSGDGEPLQLIEGVSGFDGFTTMGYSTYHVTSPTIAISYSRIDAITSLEMCSPHGCQRYNTSPEDNEPVVNDFFTQSEHSLKPGFNYYVLRGYTPTKVYQEFLIINYIDIAGPTDDDLHRQAIERPEDIYESCYKHETPETAENCFVETRKKHSISKQEACSMGEGAHAAEFLAVNRSNEYAYTDNRYMTGNKLYYAVNTSKQAYISCENEDYTIYLYSYDCVTQESEQVFKISNAGLRGKGFCGMNIAGLVNTTHLLLQPGVYERHCGPLDNYYFFDLTTKELIPLYFVILPEDESRVPRGTTKRTAALTEKTREIVWNRMLEVYKQYNDPNITDQEMCLDISFRISQTTGTEALLQRSIVTLEDQELLLSVPLIRNGSTRELDQ